MLFARVASVILFISFIAGCAGPRETREPEREEEEPAQAVRMSDFEDFDASVYQERPPQQMTTVEHDVPASLMEGRADTGTRRTAQGFRVQVYSTIDKNTAVQQEEALKQWWAENRDAAPPGLFPGEQLPVYVVYIQPYYRVRVGNFGSRDSADRARRFLASRYSDAFLVPDTVILNR